MDIVILLNIVLGCILALASLYYYWRVRTWIALASCFVGVWISLTYITRIFWVPIPIDHGTWGNWMVRPAFTITLILMTAKAVAGFKRVR